MFIRIRLGWICMPFVVAGCDGGAPMAPVSGEVTYLGKPVEGATITFVPRTRPKEGNATAVGKTDATGRFRLVTNFGSTTRDGAVLGEHAVTISKWVPPNNMSESDYEKLRKEDDAKREKGVYNPNVSVPSRIQMLPDKYSKGGNTVLKAVVSASSNDIRFALD